MDFIQQLNPSPMMLMLLVGIIALLESLALVGLLVPGVMLITRLHATWLLVGPYLATALGDARRAGNGAHTPGTRRSLVDGPGRWRPLGFNSMCPDKTQLAEATTC